jgi:ATP-dependent Clp protease ATP-binding subunit ClpA
MRKNLLDYYKSSFSNLIEAITNIYMFLFYFFSVKTLLKTLFLPWKNLVAKKVTVGFSFNEWLSRFAFNGISRMIGCFMRISMLLSYFILQILFVLIVPFIFLLFFLIIPFLYLESLFTKTEEEKKKICNELFLSQHLLMEENRNAAQQWFESYYQMHKKKKQWWKKSNLFSLPPLTRDWALGFTPTLDQYCQDLTATHYQLQREHIVDRQKEIREIEQILSQSEESNVVIVGEEGVGKRTIVDAIAKKAYEGTTNSSLMYKRVLKLDMEKILTQYTDQKQREYFLDVLLQESIEAKNCVILIDNLEKYVSTDEGKVDLTIPLEKYGKHSGIQIIGTTTPFCFQKFISTNSKINRLFTKVDVYEISEKEAETILLDNAFLYEKKHSVVIPYETIHSIIEKSSFFITHIPFPEKAIHLLDSVCAYAKQRNQTIVKPEFVDTVLSELTHVPMTLSGQMKEKLLQLELLLSQEIIQQEEAIRELTSALRRSFVLIGKRKKPLASFLFLGPTGVGKTQTAKSISSIFFGSNHLVRFDMSLYQSASDIDKLVGSMETRNPGLLTLAVRENPYGVLLLDELEKAHKDLLHIFLTILDEGYFTDGFGKTVDCKNLLIIATSNALSDELYKGEEKTNKEVVSLLVERRLFTPEFLNRFDGIVVYRPLTEESITLIAQKIIDTVRKNTLKLHKVQLTVSNEYLSKLIQLGYDPKFGARNMERLIRDDIEDTVAKMILENKVKEGDIIRL